MQTENALALLQGIVDGSVALKDAGQLSRTDIDAIARVGAAAMMGKRFDVARTVFQGLVALDPKNAEHLLHLGAVEQAAGNAAAAAAALSEFLDADLPKHNGDVARALLMRAEIVGATDKLAAARDLGAAKVLAARSADAKAVVEKELAQ